MSEESPVRPFSKSSGKTYTLVEIVDGAPTTMVDKGPDDTVFAFPKVVILELLLVLGTVAFLLLFSLVKDAPLEELANPLETTDPAKAPWYFMGLQEMLEHAHPTLSGVVLPGLAAIFLVAIPYLDHDRTGAGRWFTSRRGGGITFWTFVYGLVVSPAFILLDNFFPPRELLRDTFPAFITQAAIPGGILTALVVFPLAVLWVRSPGRPSAREVILVLFTFLLSMGFVATLTGFLFRGPGFHLFWPWDMPNGYNPFHSL